MDASPHEFVGALIDFGSEHLEYQMKAGAAIGSTVVAFFTR